MKFNVEHFLFVLACFSMCGCMSPHVIVYHTEAECLAKLHNSGYASYAEELGEPPTPVGTPINNPYALIGRWSFSYGTESVLVGGPDITRPFEKSTGVPIRVFKSKSYGVLEFRADGTYSRKTLLETGKVSEEGTWKLSCGTLEMVPTKSKSSLPIPPVTKYYGQESQLKVFDCGKGEILIPAFTPGSKAWREYVGNLKSSRTNMGRPCSQHTGYDKHGYLVSRIFFKHQGDKGFMSIHVGIADSPEMRRYKYIGPPITTQSMALSGGERQVVAQKVQNEETSVVSTIGKSTYSLESFKWEDGSDFSALFSVKLKGECSIESFFSIRQAFDAQVRNAYLQSHPSANSQHLQIDVRPNLENGVISGRVAVLTIMPISLSYDANTRRGELSVRFNAGQTEEARAWIRKNIETLARDKNIALVTGQLPPAATYYSLGEKIDGDVMEVEFRTE